MVGIEGTRVTRSVVCRVTIVTSTGWIVVESCRGLLSFRAQRVCDGIGPAC